MKRQEHAQKSKELLLSVFEYCQKNNLKIWCGESSSVFTKYVIGTASGFEYEKNYQFKYSRSITELTEEKIHRDEQFFLFDIKTLDKNFTIEPQSNLASELNPFYMELIVNVFLNNSVDFAKSFAEEWTKSSINLAYLMGYKDEQYTSGFIKSSLINTNPEKNWEQLIDIIPNDKFIECWEIEEQFDDEKKFRNQLKSIITYLDDNEIKKLFDKITNKIIEAGISDDLRLQVSYFLVDTLPKHLASQYIDKFPFINNLIEPHHKNDLFNQEYNEIIEKSTFPKNHIYDYFSSYNLNAFEYNHVALNTLKLIAENTNLTEKGLVVANVCEHNNNFVLFMSLSNNEFMNKYSVKLLFINVLEDFFNSYESENNGLSCVDFSSEILPKLVNSSIESWMLRDELENKPSNIQKNHRKI